MAPPAKFMRRQKFGLGGPVPTECPYFLFQRYCPARWIRPKYAHSIGNHQRERRGGFWKKSALSGWGAGEFFQKSLRLSL
jgi:hypothetical protein